VKKVIIGLALMCLITSCTKSTPADQSISASVSSDATLHDSYSMTLPLHYLDYSPCSEEAVQVDGQWTLKGRYLVANGTIHYRGSIQYKHVKAIGLSTGDTYILQVMQKENQVIDVAIDNTGPEGQITFKGRAKMFSPSNGQTWNASYTVKYSIDFSTWDVTYYKYDFVTECK
jgi:hypothetical protein